MSASLPMNDILEQTGLFSVYGTLKEETPAPYLVWYGNGQNTSQADNTHYFRENNYIIEYYFELKDPDTEELIETTLLEAGLNYEKSEDVYIDDEHVFLIYYYI